MTATTSTPLTPRCQRWSGAAEGSAIVFKINAQNLQVGQFAFSSNVEIGGSGGSIIPAPLLPMGVYFENTGPIRDDFVAAIVGGRLP